MIVRVMGEGQYEVGDAVAERLNELDDQAVAALERGDEAGLHESLGRMAALARSEGRRLADDDLRTSDAVIPPVDLTLEESRNLFSEDHGLIPDLPV